MIIVYHNPKCSKSRDGISFLDKINQEYKVIKYIDEGISEQNLTSIISKLNIKPIELVRVKEKIWSENYKNQNLTDVQIIKIMSENPKLIERPIVINGNKAVIARPIEKISEII